MPDGNSGHGVRRMGRCSEGCCGQLVWLRVHVWGDILERLPSHLVSLGNAPLLLVRLSGDSSLRITSSPLIKAFPGVFPQRLLWDHMCMRSIMYQWVSLRWNFGDQTIQRLNKNKYRHINHKPICVTQLKFTFTLSFLDHHCFPILFPFWSKGLIPYCLFYVVLFLLRQIYFFSSFLLYLSSEM